MIKNRTVYLLKRTDKDDDDTDIYVGSTSQPLKQRLRIHKYDARRVGYENDKLYKRMREVDLRSWEILPLFCRTCDIKTIRELERKWIGVIGADLNTYSPIMEEETVQEYQANYYKPNKESILQQQSDYYKSNIGNKVYHCDICDIPFGKKSHLNRHLNTLKHQYAYLNSVD